MLLLARGFNPGKLSSVEEMLDISAYSVGEGLVLSRGDNARMDPGNAGGHKTLPYDVVMIDSATNAI